MILRDPARISPPASEIRNENRRKFSPLTNSAVSISFAESTLPWNHAARDASTAPPAAKCRLRSDRAGLTAEFDDLLALLPSRRNPKARVRRVS